MGFEVDKSLHWTDHYVEHGFAVIKNAVDENFIAAGMEEVKRLAGTDKPLNEWLSSDKIEGTHPFDGENLKLLSSVYDQPGVRQMINTMFGSPTEWNGNRQFGLFVRAYNPKAKAEVKPRGHIDFVNCPIPVLGSGFVFQVSLVKTEPFSGNISIYPGLHKIIQKHVMENPEWRWPEQAAPLPDVEVFEFVAEPGDLMLFHHLVMHAGNGNHAANRSPRVALHCQALRHEWLKEIDPDEPDISPWKRSLALNGRYRVPADEKQVIEEFRRNRPKREPAAAMQ